MTKERFFNKPDGVIPYSTKDPGGFTFEAAEEAARLAADAAEELHGRTHGHSLKAQIDASSLHAMLDERGSRYGKFTDHARLTQNLKRLVSEELWRHRKRMADDQFEALEMIMHKVGRIVCGDPDYEDSWRDIAGYATLVADRLKTGEER